jgi:hypothetical protein
MNDITIQDDSTFGPYLKFKMPPGTDVVIVCENDYGLKPKSLCLPHQVYVEKVKDLRGLTLIPVNHEQYIVVTGSKHGRHETIVEHFGWVTCPTCKGTGRRPGNDGEMTCAWTFNGAIACGGAGVVPPN